jgi:hypothetical protein
MVVVPTSHGWLWVRRGFALFARAPIGWILAAVSYWVLMTLIGIVPYLGIAAALVLTPVFSMGFMAICREVERGRRLELPLLFAGFRTNLPALVALGGIYLALVLAVLGATQIIDGGALMRWMLLGRGPARGSPGADSVGEAAVLGCALFVPVILAFWFAPALVAWHGQSAAKALFFSFFAALRNWSAFLLYGVALAVVAGLAPGLAFSALAVATQGAKGAAATIQLFALVVVVTLLPAIYASIYASYRDVFPDDPPAPADDQPATTESSA